MIAHYYIKGKKNLEKIIFKKLQKFTKYFVDFFITHSDFGFTKPRICRIVYSILQLSEESVNDCEKIIPVSGPGHSVRAADRLRL